MLYFRYAAPTSAFRAAGSLAAVLLWVYYSSFILFFGAEFTKLWLAAPRRTTPRAGRECGVRRTGQPRGDEHSGRGKPAVRRGATVSR